LLGLLVGWTDYSAIQQKRLVLALPSLESPLDHPIFKRMTRQDNQPPAGHQHSERLSEKRLQD
jgi:hypothetical protein